MPIPCMASTLENMNPQWTSQSSSGAECSLHCSVETRSVFLRTFLCFVASYSRCFGVAYIRQFRWRSGLVWCSQIAHACSSGHRVHLFVSARRIPWVSYLSSGGNFGGCFGINALAWSWIYGAKLERTPWSRIESEWKLFAAGERRRIHAVYQPWLSPESFDNQQSDPHPAK